MLPMRFRPGYADQVIAWLIFRDRLGPDGSRPTAGPGSYGADRAQCGRGRWLGAVVIRCARPSMAAALRGRRGLR